MKIVCDACQAKYSISDDKVQGKVFKIRCKKCSNIIVVRGGAQATEPAAAAQEKDTRVYDYGYDAGGAAPADEAVWHLVINQDQVGPMTVAEVQQKFAAGEVDGETFAWREGFSDWLPLSQVDAFAGLIASGSTTAAAPPLGGGGQQAVAAMFGSGSDEMGTVRSDAGDLFSAASAPRHQEDDGGDLFGSKPAESAASAAAQQKLRGERNENSVLFSLNNLAQLASNKPAPMPAPSSGGGSQAGHATGAAGGEGSGLIDIRSMASAYLGGSGAATKPAAGAPVGSIDDLPVFGGGGFSEPAVIVPTARPAANNKIIYIMFGAVGLLAIAAIVMVIMLLKGNKAAPVASKDDTSGDVAKSDKGDTKTDTKAGDTGAAGSGSGSSAAAATGSDTKAGDTGAAGSGSASQVASADSKSGAAPVNHNAPATSATHHDPTKAAASAPGTPPHGTQVAAVTPKTSPTTATKAPDTAAKPAASDSGGCDEVSCVLNNYDGPCCAKFKKAKSGGGSSGAASSGASSGGGSDLPDLDKGMISSAMAPVKPRATACGDKSSAKGLVKVHVKVGANGSVQDVSVSQSPDPALGQCVAAAVHKATFPKTKAGGSFSYPFPF
jgi:predicted Zn finger-like uncharacterized protein